MHSLYCMPQNPKNNVNHYTLDAIVAKCNEKYSLAAQKAEIGEFIAWYMHENPYMPESAKKEAASVFQSRGYPFNELVDATALFLAYGIKLSMAKEESGYSEAAKPGSGSGKEIFKRIYGS